MNVLLLGVGMQGKAALFDLMNSPAVGQVTVADADRDAASAYVTGRGWTDRVRVEHVDAADVQALAQLTRGADVVIDLLPRMYIANVARAAIAAGAHVVNTMYVPGDLLELDAEARRRGVTILPEFGLDPGIDLVMLGDAIRSLDSVAEIHSYGAGIPEWSAAQNAIQYKISWTFEGVLQAYRRPAVAIRDGRVEQIDRTQVFAKERVHHVEMAQLGTLEAYPNGDAAHYASAANLHPPVLRTAGRYTMRWPGHCEFWKKLVDLHLLDLEPVEVDGARVDRVHYLAAALGPHLQYAAGERDLAIVRVDVVGVRDGQRMRIRHELVDAMDLTTGLSAMSRTVGFTASIGAQWLARGDVRGPGVIAPLTHVPYTAFRDALATRGVLLTREESAEDPRPAP